jgi:hypothetical protein
MESHPEGAREMITNLFLLRSFRARFAKTLDPGAACFALAPWLFFSGLSVRR